MIRLATSIVLAAGLCSAALAAEKAPRIGFKKVQLDNVFRSEGVAVGDFNNDGALDIAAGSVYYAAPDWQMHAILEQPAEFDRHGYSVSFCNFADDLNGDGWTDLIVVGFPGGDTSWFENPQSAGGPWKRHECISVTNNESPTYWDLDGDGRRELIMAFAPDPKDFDGPDRQMGFVRPAKDASQPWVATAISAKAAPGTTRFSHGLGVGDINGDGRLDVLVREGWWEQPARLVGQEWTFHPAPLGETCAQMYVYDFDGDGDNDVLSSAAHHAGIWWHEQRPEGWVTHEIDKSFSQTHALCIADINGDDLPDFVTGKRWWAHGPAGDPGSDQPAVMYWFELMREDGRPVWIPHQFDQDSGVGTQFEVADVNGDGLLDVVTANKKGAFYFEQVRREAAAGP